MKSATGKVLSRIIWTALVMGALTSHAQEKGPKEGPFDAWARWAVRNGRWKGPTVPFPSVVQRPAATQRVDSPLVPLSVHADGQAVRADMYVVLHLAEYVYAALARTGHPLPPADGGRGGTAGFDLYMDNAATDAAAAVDAADLTALYDAALVHGRIDASLSPDALPGCVAQVIAEAGLLALDPAEPAAHRLASAQLAAFYLTGSFGCRVAPAQTLDAPHQGLFRRSTGPATALFFAMLDEREHHGAGRFLHDMWRFAQQRSDDLTMARASPDLREAIERALENAGERPEDVYVDLAVARYFSGPIGRRRHAPSAVLRSLPPEAAVPIVRQVPSRTLPQHIYSSVELHQMGSAYFEVTLTKPAPGTELRVWLRAAGVGRWSLVAVRVSADFRELGRVTAAPRNTPASYLPVTLSEDTARIGLIVTRLLPRPYKPGSENESTAGFKLIVDQSTP